MGFSDGAGVTTPALVWNFSTRSTGTQIPLSWLIPMPGSAAAPLPLQHSSRTIWNASSWGPQTGWESPEKGAEPGELFSRSHFIIVAKETSSQDLAWNMSASAGPHIHLSQSALRAGAGADKGGDGGGGCSGTTAAALNRPARAGCAAWKSCQGSYKTKKIKIQMEFAPVGSGGRSLQPCSEGWHGAGMSRDTGMDHPAPLLAHH